MFEFINSKNIKVSAIGSVGIKFFSALFGFLSGVLLARILGLEGFGIYTLAFTTSTLLAVPVSLGLPNLIIRYISKYEVEDNSAAIKGLLKSANTIVIFSTLLVFVIAILSYLAWWKNLDPVLVDTLWLGLILVPLIALGSLRAAALRGLRFVILGQLPDTLLRNFLLFGSLLLYYLFEWDISPSKAMLIHIFSAFAAYLVGCIFLRQKLLTSLKEIKPIFFNKLWLREAIPFSVNSGIQVIRSKAITYLLAIFGSLEAVAIFDVAIRGATLVSFTLDALNNAIAPYISKAFENNNKVQLQKILTKTSRIVFIFSLPIALTFIFGGKILVSLIFGDEYENAYVPLVILCIGQLVSSVCGSVGMALSMTGNQAYFMKTNIYFSVSNLLIGLPLIIYLDVIGASIAVSIILIIQNIVLLGYVKKRLRVNTTIF
jgi:O-antigen/teichoic acid export membrane protein